MELILPISFEMERILVHPLLSPSARQIAIHDAIWCLVDPSWLLHTAVCLPFKGLRSLKMDPESTILAGFLLKSTMAPHSAGHMQREFSCYLQTNKQ